MSRMPISTFRLVVLISCAHALVHTFELALPAVEQMIGDEYGVGKASTGALGMAWRLPFGLGAVLAGILADRFGSRPLLIVYLVGCSFTAVLARWAPSFNMLFLVMLSMGCFASIYHPAGLALISRETTPETRGSALGLHGIIGSLGIAGAPFGAMLLFSTGNFGWRDYYLILTIPAMVIAARLLVDERRHRKQTRTQPVTVTVDPEPEAAICWRRYLVLVSAGALSGVVYGAFMHFLPRYLDTAGLRPETWTPASFRNALAAIVLGFGAIGQGVAGRLCRPGRLELLLVLVLLGNVPPLLWMAFAEGPSRFVAACVLAVIHFMNQPVYNSLIAQHIPASRRSLGYGFSNMMCFGIGAFGPCFAGQLAGDTAVYGGLAVVAAAAGGLAAYSLIIRDQRLTA
ncbi:MAG: MFS transporter [Planctomycetota bacterium]|nr:MFS transporter [Planctomycetota bacterium]